MKQRAYTVGRGASRGMRVVGIAAGTGLALASAVAAAQPALAAGETAGTSPDQGAQTAPAAAPGQTTLRAIPNVQGTFAWDQGVSATNATLATALYGAADVLCGSQANDFELSPTGAAATTIDRIAVTGDVANSFVAEVEEFEQKAPVRTILGCTCSGNPADGRASANAAVEGFQLAALIAEAAPTEGANTITFVCADGYEVALPLAYVEQRYSIIVTCINGEDASDAVGCSNQLWLGTTAARSFARDIVEVRITAEDVPPAAPGTDADANQPNVGVIEGVA